jgi:transcriptional regulator with XRE-family HTH domain
METFGEHIRRLREDRGLSQAELGRRAGLGRSHILRIESGERRKLQASTIMRLAKALKVGALTLMNTLLDAANEASGAR